MRYIVLFIVTLFLSACFNGNDYEIQEKQFIYPDWYINPPQNNQQKLYGVGSGKTKQDAIFNALDDLSSRLMLTVESTQEISSKSFRDFREYISKTTTQKINTQTQKLSFQEYKIEDFYAVSNQIYYLISVEKNSLQRTLEDEATTLYNEFNSIDNSFYDILSKNIKYKHLLEKFYTNFNKIQILQSLKNKDDQNKYMDTIKKIEEQVKENNNRISFYITSDTNSKSFEDIFKDSLNTKLYKISIANGSTNAYELNLSSNLSRSKSHGIYIIENILNVKIKNNQNNQLFSKTIEIKGASSNNFEDATINLIQKLQKYKQERDILPFD